MRAEILSIGTELLLGQITDTNAVFLAQQLAAAGIPLYFKSTVGDNPGRLREVLRIALSRSDLLICTGGLGPTEDDITTAGIADAFGVPVEVNEAAMRHIEAFFSRLNRTVSENQIKQAMLPHGAIMLPNERGTAPGFILSKDGKTAIVMPGPPHEMEAMWRHAVEPYLRSRSSGVISSRTLRFCGIGEGSLEMELKDIIAEQTNPTVAPYAKFSEVHIRLTARADSEEEAYALIAPVEARVRERVGRFIYGADDDTLEAVVGNMLRQRGMMLAVAESCTGGLLGGRITEVAGSSDYFVGGVITYSNALKRDLLGVRDTTLTAYGAVSEQTATEMAEGVVRAFGADIGISITGIAGPGGGTPEKPVGLVYIGLARCGEKGRAVRYEFPGDRAVIRGRAVMFALTQLHKMLRGMEGPDGRA